MVEVMHTTQRMQAENFGIALIAEGIDPILQEGTAYSLPTRYVVTVADSQQAAAEAVRTRLEKRWLKAPGTTVPGRTLLLIIIVVGAFFWWLTYSGGR